MKKYLSLVKFSHTIFALPFALAGLFMGYLSMGFLRPDWKLFLLVILCMVFARSAAMAFNRYADRKIDALNVRTAIREIPSGKISPAAALVMVILSSLLFIATTWFINPLCFFLSPVALLVVLGYSYTKRFTALCHLVLGLGLALAPVGAFIAVTARFELAPVLLGFAVLCWVSGFDIIYSLQDAEFDKQNRLYSIPAFLGRHKALNVSKALHFITAILLCMVVYLIPGSWFMIGGLVIFIAMLIYQHSLVKADDLSKVNLAFFTTNGIASVFFGLLTIVDILIKML